MTDTKRQPSPTLLARMEQVRKATVALADAARKIGYDLHNERIQFPESSRYVLSDLETDAHRLAEILTPVNLKPTDAENSR